MSSHSSSKSLHILDVNYSYLDSGPPASFGYTTWVFLQGMGFNAAILEKLLPLAKAHNLRIVCLYRCGYPPSSGFHDDELAKIGCEKKSGEAEPLFRSQATEIATFLVQFATEQCILMAHPGLNPNAGGIALIGDIYTQSTLQKYLHTILFHDASVFFLGIPNTPKDDNGLSPTIASALTPFFDWVTAHFIHKSVTSVNIDDLEFNNPSQDVPRSLCNLSCEQRAKYTNMEAFLHTGCDAKLVSCDITAFATLTKNALFDKVHAEKSPYVRVRFMSSGTCGGVLVWSLWMFRKHAENPRTLYGDDAQRARDIKFVTQTEGNHFIFWEDPEKAIQQ